jgi:probable phosphoglycerate mutase
LSADAAGGAPAAAGRSELECVLVRHAETEWSRDGRHTGRTDLPLTEDGRTRAGALTSQLREWRFALVLCSPARRAQETCELCGLGAQAQLRDALWEWDYGDYEGLTTPQIRELHPGWSLWRDGCPGGESAAQVGARADRVIAEVRAGAGAVAVFSHGHMLRVLGARWIALAPEYGAHLALSTAAVSVLSFEREAPVLRRWNA